MRVWALRALAEELKAARGRGEQIYMMDCRRCFVGYAQRIPALVQAGIPISPDDPGLTYSEAKYWLFGDDHDRREITLLCTGGTIHDPCDWDGQIRSLERFIGRHEQVEP